MKSVKIPSPKTKTSLLFSIVAVFLTIGAYSVGYDFVDNKLSEVASAAIDLDGEELQSQNLTTIASLMEDTTAERQIFHTLFVSSSGVIDFLSLLEEKGEENNVDLNIGRVDEKPFGAEDAPSELVKNLEISITVEGSWKSVYSYFVDIESLPAEVDIRQASFTREVIQTEEDSVLRDNWTGSFVISILQQI